MNLYFRFLLLILTRAFNKQRISPFEPCLTRVIINPLDLDFNVHVNNGRYLSIMDLGRTDLMLKAQVFWTIFKKGYYPVLTSESIRFRKSLSLFDRVDLISTLEAWDEKDFYMSQKFYNKGALVAEGYIKGRFRQRGRSGSVPTKETFEVMGLTYDQVTLTDLAQKQKEIEKLLAQQGAQ